ncbi:hypothetical protein MGN70_000387 [Eutypa lata]|uniref:Cyanovirin-N domain-containing protein n=1 Tax=Eutypa lata (strain UCR-EL1) TaxID=1287681 RepID=M7S7S1_EUTLA|nr:hypothetical protein UCREL1_10941 [Eutypa lata UCREL1]KAI1257347.1 hypothetical protein MGN70_000387 [Eutypa lata]
MMVTTLLSIFSLAFWSVMVASQDLKSSLVTAVTHVASDHYPTPTATADYGASDVIVDLATNSSIDAVGVIPPEKDIRLSCHGLSLYLSKNEPITYYLIGHCGGVYDKPHDNRCSYLDLDLCYVNIDGNIRPSKLGGFSTHCYDCTYYTSSGRNMLSCRCDGGHDEDHLVDNTIVLDDIVGVKNGFLSCYDYTNFECPYADEPPL